ncbi:MAG: peptidase M23 [Herpetosiphonaceae bacterium]|nr:MAG: peptidase M23 [Herpetosiphonaceae bacterium]
MAKALSGTLVKAELINNDTNEKVKCMFNPTDLTFSLTNTWKEVPVQRREVPYMQFAGGQASDLTLELLFDTYEKHEGFSHSAGDDVRTYSDKIWKMMRINQKTKAPPLITFQWGKFLSFKAIIKNISQTFNLFATDGTPLRTVMKVTFKQIVDPESKPRQNPTSGGETGERLRIVHEGETLAGIAYEEYQTTTAWRHLAEANNINDPRRLRPGQMLIITPLPVE